MKKLIIPVFVMLAMISFSFVSAKGDDGGSSGSSGSSGSYSNSGSSGSSSDDGSNLALETETEHGVTFTVAEDVSGNEFLKNNFGATSGLEVETEHGVTILKPHGGSSPDAVIIGQSSEGMEIETEHGVSFLKPHGERRDSALERNVSGKILLQVQANGEAWWVDPLTKARLFLGRPADAFRIMRENGLGITNADLNQIPASGENKPASRLGRQLAGRILLQVQSRGEAWYVNPANFKRYFLGRPQDAFNVMRGLGLGITDDNLNKIRTKLGEAGNRKLVIALQAQNNSGQNGYAEIKEVGNQVKVEIVLAGTPAGSSEPAHIHQGNLPNLGAVKYPLKDVMNGISQTVLNVTFDQLLSERPLGINVHKSAAEISVYVAAGNL